MYQQVQLYFSSSSKNKKKSCSDEVTDVVNNMLIILAQVIPKYEKIIIKISKLATFHLTVAICEGRP